MFGHTHYAKTERKTVSGVLLAVEGQVGGHIPGCWPLARDEVAMADGRRFVSLVCV